MKKKKMVEIFEPTRIDEMIDSQYGNIEWLTYLKKEKQRIERNPKRTAVIVLDKGFATLKVDDVGRATINKNPTQLNKTK